MPAHRYTNDIISTRF